VSCDDECGASSLMECLFHLAAPLTAGLPFCSDRVRTYIGRARNCRMIAKHLACWAVCDPNRSGLGIFTPPFPLEWRGFSFARTHRPLVFDCDVSVSQSLARMRANCGANFGMLLAPFYFVGSPCSVSGSSAPINAARVLLALPRISHALNTAAGASSIFPSMCPASACSMRPRIP